MKKIVLYACFLLLLMITNYAQTVTFDASITKATARMYVSTETIYFDFNSQHDLGMHNIAQYESNDWRSFYKVSFGEDIPVFSSIKSIELISFITEMEYSPNDFVVNIKKVPNTTNFEDADSLFGSIGYPYEPMKYYEYGDTLSENIKTFITPQDFADSFFIIGVYDNEMYNNSMAKINMQIKITYYLPIEFTIDNNFADNTGNGTRGEINIDGTNRTIPANGYSITKDVGENTSLTAISPQQNNLGHQMLWHTGTVNKSEWTRNLLFRSSEQNYSFNVTADDDGKRYVANLRKNFKVDVDHQTEFNGTQADQSTTYIVEQNSGSISSPSAKTVGSNNYNFAGWTDDASASNQRTVSPDDNETYTSLYKTTHYSNNATSIENSGQKKTVKTTDGVIHLVYESINKVWYETSTDNGSSWILSNNMKPLSEFDSKLPAIDSYGTYVVIVWQEKNGSSWEINLKSFSNGFSVVESIVDANPFTNYTSNTYPTVAWAYGGKIVVAYNDEDNGIQYKVGFLTASSITWYGFGTIAESTEGSIRSSIAARDNYHSSAVKAFGFSLEIDALTPLPQSYHKPSISSKSIEILIFPRLSKPML